jgi:hypothetical protein
VPVMTVTFLRFVIEIVRLLDPFVEAFHFFYGSCK